MSDFIKKVRSQQQIIVLLILASVLCSFFFTNKDIFLGFSLGSIVGLYNHWLLQRKVVSYTKAIIRQENPKGLGVLSRIAATMLGTMIVILFPEQFHVVAFILGLITQYIVVYVDFLRRHLRESKERR